jgi:hypothetical protein
MRMAQEVVVRDRPAVGTGVREEDDIPDANPIDNAIPR